MKTLAIYPGSFSPFTIGHKNIVDKASAIFGKENVVVAMGINPAKVSTTQIADYIKAASKESSRLSEKLGTKIITYDVFLHQLVESYEKEYNVVIIRGLRNGEDLDYEVNQIRFMDELKTGKKLNICFLMCDKEFEHISSSSIRAIQKIDPELAKKYLI